MTSEVVVLTALSLNPASRNAPENVKYDVVNTFGKLMELVK